MHQTHLTTRMNNSRPKYSNHHTSQRTPAVLAVPRETESTYEQDFPICVSFCARQNNFQPIPSLPQPKNSTAQNMDEKNTRIYTSTDNVRKRQNCARRPFRDAYKNFTNWSTKTTRCSLGQIRYNNDVQTPIIAERRRNATTHARGCTVINTGKQNRENWPSRSTLIEEKRNRRKEMRMKATDRREAVRNMGKRKLCCILALAVNLHAINQLKSSRMHTNPWESRFSVSAITRLAWKAQQSGKGKNSSTVSADRYSSGRSLVGRKTCANYSNREMAAVTATGGWQEITLKIKSSSYILGCVLLR